MEASRHGQPQLCNEFIFNQTFSLAKSLVMRKLETLKNSEKPQRKTIIMISEDTAQAEIPRLFKDALSQLTLV